MADMLKSLCERGVSLSIASNVFQRIRGWNHNKRVMADHRLEGSKRPLKGYMSFDYAVMAFSKEKINKLRLGKTCETR